MIFGALCKYRACRSHAVSCFCRDGQPGSQRRRRKPPGPPPGTPPVLSDSDDEEYDPEKGGASFPGALCNFLKCFLGVCGRVCLLGSAVKWSAIEDNNGRAVVLAGKRFQLRDGIDRKIALDGDALRGGMYFVWVRLGQWMVRDGLC